MRKVLMMFLLAATLSANATNTVNNDKRKTDLVLSDGEEGDWTMHFGLGLNVPLGVDDGYKFSPFKSWDLQWTVISYDWNPKGGSQTYGIGLGLNWSNFALNDNGSMFVKGAGDVVGLGQFAPTMGKRFSSVHRLAIDVPLLFTQEINRNFSVTVGPIVKFNAGCWLHNDYEQGDMEVETSVKNLEQRPVTVDIMAAVDICGVGVFCKYSPMSVFKKDKGPKFSSLTFGVYF